MFSGLAGAQSFLVQTVGDKRRQGQSLATAFDACAQRLAAEKLHHDVGAAAVELTEVRDLNQSGMFDPIRRPRFVEEASRGVAVAGVFGAQELDRDLAL